ncbi:MAG: NADH-quinone oxidoreductase subunit K [Rhodocyclaceae bacterium]
MSEFLLALCVAAVAAAGIYLALARDLVGVVLGLGLIGAAANLFLFAAGRVGSVTAAFVTAHGNDSSVGMANPLPQALVLTAIVIGFALSCFGIALALRLARLGGTVDADALHSAEPPPQHDGEPGVLP